MIEANQYIFQTLADFVKQSNIDSTIIEAKRYIQTDDQEKKWLKDLKIVDKQKILSNFQTAIFSFEDKQYFVVIGEDETSSIVHELIESIEINAGIITALLFELKVPIYRKVNPLEIADEIFYPPQSNQEKIPYNFSQVIKFFNQVFVYKIQVESPFSEQESNNLVRLTGFYTSNNNQMILLDFSQETIKVFERIFVESVESIPYENLLFSMVSFSWKYSFLDVYRCIERLFSISITENLYNNFDLKKYSLLKFATEIENQLSWKPKEEEAVSKLIDSSPENAMRILGNIKKVIDGNDEGDYGKLIYRIRNSIVHFRPATESIELSDEDWDKLIRALLLVVEYWYKHYHVQLIDCK